MPRRERWRRLLRQLGRFLAVVLVAGGVGIAFGVGISELTSSDEPPAETTTDTRPRGTVPTVARTTPARPGGDARGQLRVTVRAAVLYAASTPSGQRRRRARLVVRAAVENRGSERVVPPRPSLLAARQRIPTNPRADATTTRLGPIEAGETVDVTLRFETAGAVTEQLTTQRRARLLIGGRSSPITVVLGNSGARATDGAAAP
jgi:hypothetical protein